MKFILAILVLILLAPLPFLYSQPARNFKAEAAVLRKTLDENHYQPPVLDDSFSTTILETVLNQLDPDHLYFTSADMAGLEPFRNSLDDEWKGGEWIFLDRLTDLYGKALNRGATFLAAESAQKTDWKTAEVFFPEGKKAGWSRDEAEAKKRWKLWIKYNILKEVQSDSAATQKPLDFILHHELEFRNRILGDEKRRMRRILQHPDGFENYVASIYFHAFASYYDPHSLYLSPHELDNFKAAVSTQEFSFGIGLNEDEYGNIMVAYLIPGGPAWKSGKLHEGDVLTELVWGGKTKFDLKGIGLREFLELLDRSDPAVAEFTVVQSSGVAEKISLKKEKIENEENTVKGFVLNGSRKIGYISLPGFYTVWDSNESSSCANDVASEIIKLKGENIEGLILDIRSNGGGSLKEAIEMAGIFIDAGPIAIVRQKAQKNIVLKDLYRGTVYDGPLTILIDGQSASASEVLAAAIQDYHRGIIVGGSSFGKATGQKIFSLNLPGTTAVVQAQKEGFGSVTITDMRIYRITGKSNQARGVVPDVTFPDLYAVPGFHEVGLPRAFLKDSTSGSNFFTPMPPLPLEALRKKSAERIHAHNIFQRLEILKEGLEVQRKESTSATLAWQNFILKDVPKGPASREPVAVAYSVLSPEFNKIRIQGDPYFKAYSDAWVRSLTSDAYVEEAFKITCDYIQLKNK